MNKIKLIRFTCIAIITITIGCNKKITDMQSNDAKSKSPSHIQNEIPRVDPKTIISLKDVLPYLVKGYKGTKFSEILGEGKPIGRLNAGYKIQYNLSDGNILVLFFVGSGGLTFASIEDKNMAIICLLKLDK